MKKIGIVTINFNTEDLLKKLINCLTEQTYKNWVLLIVNNSPDNSAILEVIRDLDDKRVILAGRNENIGYSKGNNLGYDHLIDNNMISDGDIVLFTNEDIVIEDKSFLEKALRSFDKYDCGFLGPRIINNDGSQMLPHKKETGYLKCLFHMGNNGRVDRALGINRSMKKVRKPLEVFLLNGACFFCRVHDFKRAGLFDTNTFIYFEEELIFRRAREKGIRVYYDPELTVYHEHSASVKKSFSLLNKKRFVYAGEIYFLTSVLKVNKLLLWLFMMERRLEFFLFRIGPGVKTR